MGYGQNKSTVWYDCSLWGERANKLSQYLKKGKAVQVAGEFIPSSYQKKDGSHGMSLGIHVASVSFVPAGEKKSQAQQPKTRFGGDQPLPDDINNIPF
jgi:single-strand DNA-binding protein